MYTQCPDCGTAFRVTAEVLRQAAGKVRCGGCGNAFNALDFLSEQKPVTPVRPAPEEQPGEPAAEPPRLEADEPPETISAKRSAALLKTLDELAGSNIRIEDTGIEWRVLDTDSGEHALREPEDEAELADDDTGSMRWFIDDSPTPVDEHLSAEPGGIDAPEIFATDGEAGATEEMRFDDDTPLPEDFDFDREPAEAGPSPASEVRETTVKRDTAQVDLELGEPEDWEDLLGEVDEAAEAVAEDEPAIVEAEEPTAAEHDETDEPLPDVDTQFATQAEAMGIDISGIHARDEADEIAGDDDTELSTIDDDLIAAAFESEGQAAKHDAGDESIAVEPEDEEYEFLELEIDEAEDLLEPRDRELVSRSQEDATLAAELGLDDDVDADDEEEFDIEAAAERSGDDDDKPEHVIPPMTEEEQTINMMIDQDLLAIAVEDEEGFTSTIIQKQRPEPGDEPETEDEERPVAAALAEDLAEGSPLVETIIMEGEFVRDAFEEDKLEEERRKAAKAEAEEASAANSADSEKERQAEVKEPLDYRLVAGIAALALLLGAQFVHQSRESFAVYRAFNGSVGSIYRMFGTPVTPAWDITGWRFEATKGSTDQSDEVLTIYSRIGNKSGEALPYPLINVSLTDRFEDIIGSKVLEPGDYLAESLDTRTPVPPGETFSALIAIDAPDPNATGFKLNVCYRQPGGRLRCAIDDFR